MSLGKYEIWNFGELNDFPPFRGGIAITILCDQNIYTDDKELADYLGSFPKVHVNVRELEVSEESLADLPMKTLHQLANQLRRKGENFFGRTKNSLIGLIERRRNS